MKSWYGCENQSSALPRMVSSVNTMSQGLRRPPMSAIAPKIGLRTAIVSALTVIAQPQSAVPSTEVRAIPSLK